MACTHNLTDWPNKPYYFEGFPLYQTRLDIAAGSVSNVLLSNPSDYIEYEHCASIRYPIYLAWFNGKGGWDMWLFGSKHDYNLEISGGKTYKDFSQFKRWADRGEVLEVVNVKSGLLSKSQLEVVANIYKSKQVYQYKDSAWLPVFIREGQFFLRKEGDKNYQVNFTLEYAAQSVQTQ